MGIRIIHGGVSPAQDEALRRSSGLLTGALQNDRQMDLRERAYEDELALATQRIEAQQQQAHMDAQGAALGGQAKALGEAGMLNAPAEYGFADPSIQGPVVPAGLVDDDNPLGLVPGRDYESVLNDKARSIYADLSPEAQQRFSADLEEAERAQLLEVNLGRAAQQIQLAAGLPTFNAEAAKSVAQQMAEGQVTAREGLEQIDRLVSEAEFELDLQGAMSLFNEARSNEALQYDEEAQKRMSEVSRALLAAKPGDSMAYAKGMLNSLLGRPVPQPQIRAIEDVARKEGSERASAAWQAQYGPPGLRATYTGGGDSPAQDVPEDVIRSLMALDDEDLSDSEYEKRAEKLLADYGGRDAFSEVGRRIAALRLSASAQREADAFEQAHRKAFENVPGGASQIFLD